MRLAQQLVGWDKKVKEHALDESASVIRKAAVYCLGVISREDAGSGTTVR